MARQPSRENIEAGLHILSQELVLIENIPALADGQVIHNRIQALE